MVKIIAVAAAILGTASVASAADMAARPYNKAPMVAAPIAYDWSGFYIGAHVGGGWKSNDWFEDATLTASGGIGPVGFRDASHDASGVIGGGQIGYNYQSGWVVFGIEGDVSGSGIKGTGGCFPQVIGTVQTCTTDVRWMATFTGRVGAAFNNALFYVKGGWAWADENLQNFCNNCGALGGPNTWQSSGHRDGGTVGVGIEYGFTPNWSAKIEYDYIAFGTRNTAFTSPVGPFTEDVRQNISLVKAGVNYRFNWGGAPLVAKY
jgi:outer membrane immunogenic protein